MGVSRAESRAESRCLREASVGLDPVEAGQ